MAMYKYKIEELKNKMNNLYNEYGINDEECYKYKKLYYLTHKLSIPLFISTVVELSVMILVNHYIFPLYLASLICFYTNYIIMNKSEKKYKDYNKKLIKIKSDILQIEEEIIFKNSIDLKLNQTNDNSYELKSINDCERIDDIKLSKHHDIKYSQEEARYYEKSNDLRYNPDRYGIHTLPLKDRFNPQLTGDYENPVFVLMDNKGKILTKRPKYNKNS